MRKAVQQIMLGTVTGSETAARSTLQHLEETLQFVGLQQKYASDGNEIVAELGEEEDDSGQQAAILCDDGAQGHARDAHAHGVDEDDAQNDVDHIGQDGDDHGDGGVLHADVPAVERIEAEHRRCRPDAYPEICGGIGQHLLATVQQFHAEPFHWTL